MQANTRDHSEEGLLGSHCVIVLGNRFVLLEMGWMFPGTPPLFLGTFWLLGEASSFLGTVRACPFKRYRNPHSLHVRQALPARLTPNRGQFATNPLLWNDWVSPQTMIHSGRNGNGDQNL